MPRRWATQTRFWAYRFLCLRDGEHCQICGDPPTTPYSLDIDHIDADPDNNAESNLRLLCRSCNVARENRPRRRRPSVPEREREHPMTRVAKLAIPYASGSAEMQANMLFEVDYRAWLSGFLSEHGFITKKEAVNAGAEVVGCNPTTASKYLAKLTSIVGPMMETTDMLQGSVVTLRPSPNGHSRARTPTPKKGEPCP